MKQKIAYIQLGIVFVVIFLCITKTYSDYLIMVEKTSVKDLQTQIMEAALEVHKNMGLGFQEPAYSQALAYEFDLRKIDYERKKDIKVSYKGSVAGEYTLEFVVRNSIIVMIKSGEQIAELDESKMKSFLKATKLDLGMIIDFGKKVLEIKSVTK
ncbi:MAG: GxxExxY protein [candidate division Zixibacteria bacterium]|nr:GxxExxY protein [candidate division Zixibacteria bacterium]